MTKGAKITLAELREHYAAIRMFDMFAAKMRQQGKTKVEIQRFLAPIAFRSLDILRQHCQQLPEVRDLRFRRAKAKGGSKKEIAFNAQMSRQALHKRLKKKDVNQRSLGDKKRRSAPFAARERR